MLWEAYGPLHQRIVSVSKQSKVVQATCGQYLVGSVCLLITTASLKHGSVLLKMPSVVKWPGPCQYRSGPSFYLRCADCLNQIWFRSRLASSVKCQFQSEFQFPISAATKQRGTELGYSPKHARDACLVCHNEDEQSAHLRDEFYPLR